MAYYLKKTKKKDDIYLQIYKSYYDNNKEQVVSKNHKAIGYVSNLKNELKTDPIAYYQSKVNKLNEETKLAKQIENQETVKDGQYNFGHFLLHLVTSKLGIIPELNAINYNRELPCGFASLLLDLVYARVVDPSSKLKTYEEIMPYLIGSNYKSNLKNLYNGLAFIGENYERIIELYNYHFAKLFCRDTSKTYFDGTNFYFEINRENDVRKRGFSKENQQSPIISMGLLLDKDIIPLAMKLYPGNQNEKPYLRQAINDMKKQQAITGKTIQVADKGLNCAKNILEAIKNGDGYIFSKSVKQLPAEELNAFESVPWVNKIDEITGEIINRFKSLIVEKEYQYKNENGQIIKGVIKEKRVLTWNNKLYGKHKYEFDKTIEKLINQTSYDIKRNTYGLKAKYVIVNDNDPVDIKLDDEKIKQDEKLLGYSLIISSEIDMSDEDIYNAYRQLWHIEETFKMMKSSLLARPVYLQKKESIYGHFLIIYLAVCYIRILELKILKGKLHYNKIIEIIRELKCIKFDNPIRYINCHKLTNELKIICSEFNVNIDKLIINKKEMIKLFKLKH